MNSSDSDRSLPPALLPGGAFVVQLAIGVDPEADRFLGRIEHVSSGASVRFQSSRELLEFIGRTIVGESGKKPLLG